METPGEEQVRLDERRHGIVLAAPFLRASVLGAAGVACVWAGWPATALGAPLLAAAALLVVAAVWRWHSTRVVLTSEKLFVVHGTVRRRAAAVRLGHVPIEVEQGLLGQLLGYGTVVAGDLEITHVPRPSRLLERIAA